MKAKTDIVQSPIYGLAAGVATVAVQLGMNWLYRLAMVQLSHQSLRKLLIGSFAVIVRSSLLGGWLLELLCLECLVPTTAIIRQTCE